MHFWGHNIFSFVKSKDSYQNEKQSDIVLIISQSHNRKDDSHGNINLIKNCLNYDLAAVREKKVNDLCFSFRKNPIL